MCQALVAVLFSISMPISSTILASSTLPHKNRVLCILDFYFHIRVPSTGKYKIEKGEAFAKNYLTFGASYDNKMGKMN